MNTGITGKFTQVSTSKNLSQLVRSNAPEYWEHMKKNADLRKLKPYLSFEGTVAGDPHLGNFAPLPLTTVGGSREMRFVDIDFDDAGRAPFVLDFIRYVTAIKAQSKQSKRKALQEAYVLGLRGKKLIPPKKVQECLDMHVGDYDAMAELYAARKSSNVGFVRQEGEIEPYTGAIAIPTIEKLFPGKRLIDVAIRGSNRGGSLDQLRIWVLLETPGSKRHIAELKQYAPPGTAKYQDQPPVKEWLAGIREAFWPGLRGADYDLVDIPGSGLFWIRPKKVTLINVPYTSQKKHEVQFVVDLAIYDANILGLAHGRQPQAAAYLSVIKKDSQYFHDATGEVEEAYLKLAKEVRDEC